LDENLFRLGSRFGRFQRSDPDLDPVKNHPDPQHCLYLSNFAFPNLHCKKALTRVSGAQIELFDEKKPEAENLVTGSL
jgi:hypothetical protein